MNEVTSYLFHYGIVQDGHGCLLRYFGQIIENYVSKY